MRFVAVIIGTEILNGRRADAHFAFLSQALKERNHTLWASITIADDPVLIESVLSMVAADPQVVLFCFGGIGATPDDYTRACAARIFTGGELAYHPEGLKRVRAQFVTPLPYQVEMVNFPLGAEILENPVNQIPGFSLFGRFFFLPGFPSMAHPMATWALDQHFQSAEPLFSRELVVQAGEGALIELMEALSISISLSCLPESSGLKRQTTLQLTSGDEVLLQEGFAQLCAGLEARAITFEILKGSNGI